MVSNTNVNLYPPYVNADGLMVFYPSAEERTGAGGSFSTMNGNVHTLEYDVDWNDLKLGTAATSLYVLDYHNYLPDNVVVEKCEWTTTEAWDSASNNVAINFGTVTLPTTAGAYTIIDADGLVNSLAKADIDQLGALILVAPTDTDPAPTYAGAQLGVVLTEPALVVGYWETSVPTVGHGKLRVFYRHHNE